MRQVNYLALTGLMQQFPLHTKRFCMLLMLVVVSFEPAAAQDKTLKAKVPVFRGKNLETVEAKLVQAQPDERIRRLFSDGSDIMAEAFSGNYYQVVPAIGSLLLTPTPNYAFKPTDERKPPANLAPRTHAFSKESGDIRYAWFSDAIKLKATQSKAGLVSASGLKDFYPTQLNVLMANGQILSYQPEQKDGEIVIFEDNQPIITDINNDKLNEVIVTQRVTGKSSHAVMLMPNLDKLVPVVDFPKDKNNFWSKAIAAEDFDGDGYSEVAAIVAPEAISYFKLYEIQRGQYVEQDSAYGYLIPDAGSPTLIHDFNEDGVKDLFLLRNDLQGININTYARGFLERLVELELKSRMIGEFVVAYKKGYPYRISFLLNNGTINMLQLSPALPPAN